MSSKFLTVIAKDRKGRNFREYVQAVDWGYNEYWSIMIAWHNGEVDFITQYNPPTFCEDEPCFHFPRNHLNDSTFDYEGNQIMNTHGEDLV